MGGSTTSRFERRRAISELVSSLAVLVITIALLGATGVVALGSVRSSGGSVAKLVTFSGSVMKPMLSPCTKPSTQSSSR